MSLFGIGIDILHVPRIAVLSARRGANRLAARILSPAEQARFAEFSSQEVDAQTRFLAVRCAVFASSAPVASPIDQSHILVFMHG
jgi:phosphopantetheinyl transferase (holo-ACP synthase)